MSYSVNIVSSGSRKVDNNAIVSAVSEIIGLNKNSITPITGVYAHLKESLNVSGKHAETSFRGAMREARTIETATATIRIDIAKNLSKEIQDLIRPLGLPDSKFFIVVTMKKQAEQGTETVEAVTETVTETVTEKPIRIKRT